jgi:hypothetical protein
MEVLFTTTTLLAAAPPKVTVAPARKPVPVIVTPLPPLLDPELGEIELTVGAGLGEPIWRKFAIDGTPWLLSKKSM